MPFSDRGKHTRPRCGDGSGRTHSYGKPFGRDGVLISWCKNCDHYSFKCAGKYDRERVNTAIQAFLEWRKSEEEK